jgi:hypothetical protein
VRAVEALPIDQIVGCSPELTWSSGYQANKKSQESGQLHFSILVQDSEASKGFEYSSDECSSDECSSDDVGNFGECEVENFRRVRL